MPDGEFSMVKPYLTGNPEFGMLETAPKVGAYYYVYGGAVSTYKKVSATIILPSKVDFKGTGLGRNGYISFGIRTESQGGVDIGLRNLSGGVKGGKGWTPVCYEVIENLTYEKDVAPQGATKAFVVITPNLTTKQDIQMEVTWYNGNVNLGIKKYNFRLSKPYSWTKFYRFASLPSNNPSATRTDGTFMIGGEFANVKIGSANWGISTGQVEKAWIYSHPKCQHPDGYWDTGEQFRIDHWA